MYICICTSNDTEFHPRDCSTDRKSAECCTIYSGSIHLRGSRGWKGWMNEAGKRNDKRRDGTLAAVTAKEREGSRREVGGDIMNIRSLVLPTYMLIYMCASASVACTTDLYWYSCRRSRICKNISNVLEQNVPRRTIRVNHLLSPW